MNTRSLFGLVVAEDVATICACGDLDMESAPRLRAVVRLAFAQGARSIVIDAGDLRYVNSAGVRLLEEIRTEAEQLGGALSIIEARDAVFRMLSISEHTLDITRLAPERLDADLLPLIPAVAAG